MVRRVFLWIGLALIVGGPLGAVDVKPLTTTPADRPDRIWRDRHDANLKLRAAGADIVLIGDSITQGWERDGKAIWAEKIQPLKPLNLGYDGDRTQHVLWRITEGKELEGVSPKLAVLLIGTNNLSANTPREIATGIKAVVAELRKQKPDMKILLLGVLPRSAEPKGQFREQITELNKELADLKDAGVRFLDLGDKFVDGQGRIAEDVMPDQLHLSAKGYGIFAAALVPVLEEMLKR